MSLWCSEHSKAGRNLSAYCSNVSNILWNLTTTKTLLLFFFFRSLLQEHKFSLRLPAVFQQQKAPNSLHKPLRTISNYPKFAGTQDLFQKRHLTPAGTWWSGRSALSLLSNPVSCSERCCFCFGIWLLLCSGPPHPDILTSLHFLFLFPSLPLFPVLHRLLLLLLSLSVSECVFWSRRHCTLPTFVQEWALCLVLVCFLAWWTWCLRSLYCTHTSSGVMSEGEEGGS